MSARFEGKVAIVTGAASGIGRAIAARLAAEGAAIVAFDRDGDALEAATADIADAGGGGASGLTGSVTDGEAAAEAVAIARDRFGRLDVLVNNAAFTIHPNLEACPPEAWREEIEVTLTGPYTLCRAALPAMGRGGAVVNIGSVNALVYLGNPAYSAAKAGLANFTRALAVEYGPKGIRANMVSPGTVETEAPTWVARRRKDPAIFDKLARWYPVGRVGRPTDIASAVAFLASDEAGFVNGANLVVDGGLTAGMGVMVEEITIEREDA
ncbi:MAG: SDR family oxidoreductase [Azospirillaceae bacterium]